MSVSMPLGTFYSRNTNQLKTLFGNLGAAWDAHDPAANAKTAQALWLGPEHTKIVASYPDGLLETQLPLFEQMGLIGATLPEPGTVVGQTCIIGGTTNANVKRWQLIKQMEADGCQLGEVIGWFGQRLREARDGSVTDILGRLYRAGGVELLNHPWVQEQLALDDDELDPWQRPFATEYEIGIMTALLIFGSDLEFSWMMGDTNQATVTGAPRRYELYSIWILPNGRELTMLNARAQERIMDGRPAEPRHTTASCTKESLGLFPPSDNASVMVISGNPHTERTIWDTWNVMTNAGRDDLSIVVVGTVEAQTPALPKTCLGEIARMLKNEILD